MLGVSACLDCLKGHVWKTLYRIEDEGLDQESYGGHSRQLHTADIQHQV